MKEAQALTQGQIIAIDGKTLKGSYNREDKKSAIHMVNAFSVANGVVFGQYKTEAKSNEIKAIPELLSLLDIEGALITIDAMGTQADIAHTITNKGGDFLLAVKGNQESLQKAVKTVFERTDLDDLPAITIENSHGRNEYREAQAIEVSSDLFDEK